ncbi:NAD(P)/FAD-dependent oxidoreductase [Vagococcus sp. BWB3-3]|uniref:Ferredoxin--NADP reductase n=1 Tax=Vagococcus allomyrinae TaxID=2794353 RepID=A0A940PHV4_9ENTE|nr:NAD(P)/FAD-dependent oxidoreductase [Vagococcus allomyrinae]MBP1043208.1 NAD(P)/FAD-dependent oxidoreductase [Vagococcus allomyrinae]
MSTNEIYDITIIGGGPTGLFAAFYAGMRQAKTKVIESLPQLGGQLAMLYPEKKIYDIAGFPDVKASELVNNLIQQIERFEQTICLEEEVLDLIKVEDNIIKIVTTAGEHLSHSVIITAGNGAFQPRKLQMEQADKLEGQSLHYYVTDTEKFRDKNVMICGGGDSAIDWSLMLEPIAKTVTLVHRRPDFRAHEHSVQLLTNSSIKVRTPFVVDELITENHGLSAIKLSNPKESLQEIMPIDELIVNYGFSSSLGEIKNWDLDFSRHSILVGSDMSTSMPGVYAAGDICTYEGKVKLIATGFGEAPTAVNNALHYIRPDIRTQPTHSTSLFEGQ